MFWDVFICRRLHLTVCPPPPSLLQGSPRATAAKSLQLTFWAGCSLLLLLCLWGYPAQQTVVQGEEQEDGGAATGNELVLDDAS